MNKLIISIALALGAILMVPSVVRGESQTCVTQYGGAVVCGAATPSFHPLKKTGIADINFGLVGTLFVGASVVLYIKSKRTVAH